MSSPIRSALVSKSHLHAAVKDGISAMKKGHRDLVAREIRAAFADSIDLDDAVRKGHEGEHRWDYLLGHGETVKIVGLEPHSAETKEVATVINKRKRARTQLAEHLKPGLQIAAWFWVASGRIDFLPHEKTMLSLDQNGITFVGKMLLEKHLASLRTSKKK